MTLIGALHLRGKSEENSLWFRLLCLDSAIQVLITIVISRALCSTDFDSLGARWSVGMISRFRLITLICDFNCLSLFLWFPHGKCEHNQSDASSSCLQLLRITSFCFYEGDQYLSAVTQSETIALDVVDESELDANRRHRTIVKTSGTRSNSVDQWCLQ